MSDLANPEKWPMPGEPLEPHGNHDIATFIKDTDEAIAGQRRNRLIMARLGEVASFVVPAGGGLILSKNDNACEVVSVIAAIAVCRFAVRMTERYITPWINSRAQDKLRRRDNRARLYH